jgi:hypothetical protein
MNFVSISNQTTIPVAKVATTSSSNGIVSTTPIAYVLPSTVPESDLTTSTTSTTSTTATTAICRHCGRRFTRNPTVGPTCDEYFRCGKCRGISSKSFGCILS